MVGKIKALLMNVYAYFSHNLKRNLERWKLVKVMESKGFQDFAKHRDLGGLTWLFLLGWVLNNLRLS
jgi:hypothetical protein